jgi:hypothetical protein
MSKKELLLELSEAFRPMVLRKELRLKIKDEDLKK